MCHTVIVDYFNIKEKALSNFCLPVFLDIHRNLKTKRFFQFNGGTFILVIPMIKIVKLGKMTHLFLPAH
jgi:hypothetical protein